jgi:hypothetical protein
MMTTPTDPLLQEPLSHDFATTDTSMSCLLQDEYRLAEIEELSQVPQITDEWVELNG